MASTPIAFLRLFSEGNCLLWTSSYCSSNLLLQMSWNIRINDFSATTIIIGENIWCDFVAATVPLACNAVN